MRVVKLAALVAIGVALLVAPFAAFSGDPAGLDLFKLVVGMNQDELCREALLLYPEEGVAHNRATHRLAARLTANRYGVIVTLAGGVVNEIVEGVGLAAFGLNPFRRENVDETLGDLGANWRGVKDSLREK